MKGSPPPLPKLLIASSSAMVVMDDWVKEDSPPLGGCTSGTLVVAKGEDFRLNGLTQSQKWPVDFVRPRRLWCGIRAARFGTG